MRRVGFVNWVMLLVLGVSSVPQALAVELQAPPQPFVFHLKEVSREAYLAQLQGYRTLLEACRTNPKACDAKAVGEDVQVAASAGRPAFAMRWGWLRETLTAAPDAKGGSRDKLFRNAGRRLDQETADAAGTTAAPDVSAAAGRAQAILAESQFRHVAQTSWLQEQMLAFQLFWSSIFGGFRNMLPSSPWIGEVVQWAILAVAAIAVGFWAWTTTRQQRVAIAGERGAAPLWQAESERWAERADTEAARGDWREAVHCLYWAAIVMLEGQKLWRENRTRTPREYVRLLEPGSKRAGLLGGLTGVFERIWYGLRAAERADYEQARGLLEQLRAG